MRTKLLVTFVFAVFGLVLIASSSSKVSAFSCNWIPGGSDWSDSNNWVGTCVSGAGIPIDGDDVNIPNNISTNNDIVGLVLNTLTFSGSPGGTLTGNALGITTSINSSFPHIINVGITLEGNASFSTNAYNGTVNLNGFNLTASPSVIPWGISSQVTGTGTITATDTDTFYLTGGAGVGTKTINASGNSTVVLTGSGWTTSTDVNLQNGATMSYGSARNVSSDGTGTIMPFDGVLPSDLTVAQTLGLQSGDTAAFRLVSTGIAGQDYDTLNVGTMNINGATLSISLDPGYIPAGADTFTLVSATTSVTGTFAGLPDGSVVHVGSQDFIIEYDTNSVILHAVGGQIDLFVGAYTATPSAPTAGEPVTIFIVWGSNFQMPTGTAELFDGATSLGTVPVVAGNSTFVLPGGFTAGTHSLTVQYSGDLLHDAAVSSPLILTVAGLADTGIHLPVGLMVLGLVLSLGGVVLIKKKY